MSFLTFKSFIQADANCMFLNKLEQDNVKKQNQQPQSPSQTSKDQPIGSFAIDNKIKSQKRIKKAGSICNFISKVYNMLQQKQIHNIVSWVENRYIGSEKKIQGNQSYQHFKEPNPSSFQIIDVIKFEEYILPKYFKHSNLSSFVRQLNMYGFHKLRGQKGEFQFQHQKFQRSRRDLLPQIRRKGPQFMTLLTTSIPDAPAHKIKQYPSIMVPFSTQNFPVSQKDIQGLKQQQSDNPIFPSQGFINAQSYCENVQVIQSEQKKIERLSQENGLLRQIKQSKMQRIKQLGAMNKTGSEIKLAKMVYILMTQQLKKQYSIQNKTFYNAQQPSLSCLQVRSKTITSTMVNLNQLVQHVLSNESVQKFSRYNKFLLQKQN